MRIPNLLTSVSLLFGLALPGTLHADGARAELQPRPTPVAMPYQNAAAVWEAKKADFLNATGELSALIDRDYLSIKALRPELRLVWDQKAGRIEIVGGRDLGTESATSLELELIQTPAGWQIERGRVVLGGQPYEVHGGSVTVQTDADSGRVSGEFSLAARRGGLRPGTIQVKRGRFELRPAK